MADDTTEIRSLTARSAVLSVLLGAHPPHAPVSAIVRLGLELGVQETTIRAALTRMVAAGDLERDDAVYRLAPRLRTRQLLQDQALDPDLEPWHGDWRLVLVTGSADAAADRTALRELLQADKFGEIREGAWGRPANLAPSVQVSEHPRLTEFIGRPSEPEALAQRLFRPAEWADVARSLGSALDAATAMRDRLAVAAAMVRHILHDPLLPAPYLPAAWPGEELRAVYGEFRAEFTAFAGSFLGAPANDFG